MAVTHYSGNNLRKYFVTISWRLPFASLIRANLFVYTAYVKLSPGCKKLPAAFRGGAKRFRGIIMRKQEFGFVFWILPPLNLIPPLNQIITVLEWGGVFEALKCPITAATMHHGIAALLIGHFLENTHSLTPDKKHSWLVLAHSLPGDQIHGCQEFFINGHLRNMNVTATGIVTMLVTTVGARPRCLRTQEQHRGLEWHQSRINGSLRGLFQILLGKSEAGGGGVTSIDTKTY